MRVLLRACSIALATSLIVAGSAGAQGATVPVKLGYINSGLLMQQAPGRSDAQAVFEKEVAGYRQQIQRMDDSLRILMVAFDRESPKLDSTSRDARRMLISQRETEYRLRARGMDSTMQTREAELLRPIMERVHNVIEAIRSEDGYSMILDVGAQVSIVVAADKRLDITDRVLARLKSQGPPPAAPTGATPQPAGVTRPKR